MTTLVDPIRSFQLVQLTFFISLSVAMKKSTTVGLFRTYQSRIELIAGTRRRHDADENALGLGERLVAKVTTRASSDIEELTARSDGKR